MAPSLIFFHCPNLCLCLFFCSTYLPRFDASVLFTELFDLICRRCLPIVLRLLFVPLPPHGNWDASPLLASRYTGRSGRTRTWPRTRCSAWPSSPPCTGPSSPTRAPRCLTWPTWWRVCSAWSTGQCLETNGCFVDDQRFVLSRSSFATASVVMTAHH